MSGGGLFLRQANIGMWLVWTGLTLLAVTVERNFSDIAPVTILNVEYDELTDQIRYERVVSRDVRAEYISDLVESDTERSVPECYNRGRADYGHSESNVQYFEIDRFFKQGCSESVIDCVPYDIVAEVIPYDGRSSQMRSVSPMIRGQCE